MGQWQEQIRQALSAQEVPFPDVQYDDENETALLNAKADDRTVRIVRDRLQRWAPKGWTVERVPKA